jgi:hypothetical protein
MLERSQCKSSGGKQYDPQVGAAAAANTALAERSQQWTEDFYDKYIAPLMDGELKATEANTRQQGELFEENISQMRTASERYKTLGIPAEEKYYAAVKEFSAPEEQERAAAAAIGDLKTSAAGRDAALMRKFGGLGIDPTSPAGMAAMSDFAVMDAAAEAGAATRARSAAKTLGLSLTADAANFGRGGASQVLGFGGAAGQNSSAAAAGAQAGVGAGVAGAAPMAGAFGVAQRAYGANLDAYTSLQKQQMETDAAGAGGFGKLLGTIASAAIKPSDRRVKANIRHVGTLANGLKGYSYNYIWDPPEVRQVGLMADEVELVYPDAVIVRDGFKHVDYSKVPL